MKLELPTAAPRAVALDLDGTLLNSRGRLSGRTAAALQAYKRQGGTVILATGRPLRMVLPLLEATDAVDYMICFNGAYVSDREGLWTRYYPIANAVAKEAHAAVLQRHPAGIVFWETDMEWFANRLPLPEEQSWFAHEEDMRQPHLLNKKLMDAVLPAKLMVPYIYNTPALTELVDLNVMRLHNTPFIEIADRQVSKATGLMKVLRRAAIACHEVAVFGDDTNDLSMFDQFERSYAMGNALPGIRMRAAYVLSSNDEDGVAVQLERWLNEG